MAAFVKPKTESFGSFVGSKAYCLAKKPAPFSKSTEIAPPSALTETYLSSLDGSVVASSHEVFHMVINAGKEKGTKVFYKKCDAHYPPFLAQIEAATSESLRIVRGECAALVRPVVDSKGNVIGSISYEISTFQSFSGQSMSASVMLSMGIIEELVARYVRMEDDLHIYNIGIAKDLGVVGIDFDMTWYPFTVSFKGGDRTISYGPAATIFPITDHDIDHFPAIRDAKPCYWPTRSPGNGNLMKSYSNMDEFLKMGDDSKVVHYKYQAFLKELLIDKQTHYQVLARNFERTEKAESTFKDFKSVVEARYDDLEDKLINNRGFRRFVVNELTALKVCLNDFSKYNSKVSRNEIRFDLDQISDGFGEIIRKCLVKELTDGLYELGSQLKADKWKWENYGGSYGEMIDVIEKFQTSKNSIKTDYSEMCMALELLRQNLGSRGSRWGRFCSDLNAVMDNYRGVITGRSEMPNESIYFKRSLTDSFSTEERRRNVEEALVKAMSETLQSVEHREQIIKVVEECRDKYLPFGAESSLGYFNPKAYSRKRGPEIKSLIKNIKILNSNNILPYVVKFLQKGEWNPSTFFTNASMNVLLMSELTQLTLKIFKKQLTLTQLRDHDLVELSFAVDRGEWNAEEAAKRVSEIFKKKVSEEKTATK